MRARPAERRGLPRAAQTTGWPCRCGARAWRSRCTSAAGGPAGPRWRGWARSWRPALPPCTRPACCTATSSPATCSWVRRAAALQPRSGRLLWPYPLRCLIEPHAAHAQTRKRLLEQQTVGLAMERSRAHFGEMPAATPAAAESAQRTIDEVGCLSGPPHASAVQSFQGRRAAGRRGWDGAAERLWPGGGRGGAGGGAGRRAQRARRRQALRRLPQAPRGARAPPGGARSGSRPSCRGPCWREASCA